MLISYPLNHPPRPELYCVPGVYNAIQRWVADNQPYITPTPDYCRKVILSTPAPGYALRTTYGYESDTVVGFHVADDWLQANRGDQDYTIRIWYRDACSGPCDTWSLRTYDANGTPRITTITKQGPDFGISPRSRETWLSPTRAGRGLTSSC